MLRRKTLVLDLDETLIHSHHDGVIRETVKPGTPPDFVLKVIIGLVKQNKNERKNECKIVYFLILQF